jgi:hypothetical protein
VLMLTCPQRCDCRLWMFWVAQDVRLGWRRGWDPQTAGRECCGVLVKDAPGHMMRSKPGEGDEV